MPQPIARLHGNVSCPAILLVSLCASALAEGRPLGLVIEAEHFAIPYCADWTPQAGLGWYAKEHIHGSGRAVAICDEHNQGAEMYYRLQEKLRPGKYFLYVLYYPMHGGGENSIQVCLGSTKGEAFKATSSQTLSWSKKRWYTWAELPFELALAADTIRVKALKVERKSIGDIPDEPYALIFLDSFYLSDKPGLELGKGRTRYWSLNLRVAEAKEAKPMAAAGERAPTFGEAKERENLVRNGGFESGLLPYWFGWKCDRWCPLSPRPGTRERLRNVRLMSDSASTTLTPANLTKEEKHEGQYALRLPLEKGWLKESGDLRSCGIASFPFPVAPRKVAVSFWAKTDGRGAQYACGLDDYGRIGAAYSRYFYQAHGRVLAVIDGKLSNDWRRYQGQLEVKPGVDEAVFWFFAFGDRPGNVFLDAVQVELGEATGYKQRQPEVGVVSPAVGRVYYDTEPVTFRVMASGETPNLKCRYQVTDVFRDRVEEGSLGLKLAAGHGEAELALQLRRRGSYLLEVWPDGDDRFTSQLAFHIIPPPKERNRTGVIASRANCEAAIRFFERVGIRYNGYLWDQQFIGRHCNPEAGRYVWYDEIRQRKARAGITEVPWLWADQAAEWCRDPAKSPIGISGSNLNWPSPEAYGKFVFDMASHYQGLTHWVLGDELDQQVRPEDYAPYLRAALDALKRANPKARGVPSGSPLWSQRIYDAIGWDQCETLGGSYHNCSEGWYWQEQEILDKQGKQRPWHLGVGWGCRSMYTFAEADSKATSPFAPGLRLAKDLSMQCALVAPEFFTQYTTRYGPPDPFNFFEFDGSFKAQGITYVLILDFLADAGRGGKVVNRNAGDRVKAFWLNKPGGVVIALWGRGDLKLAVPQEKVQLYDVLTNRIPFPSDGLLSLNEERLYFLEDRGLGKQPLLDAVANAEVTFPDDVKCVILPGEGKNEIDLGILLRRSRAGTYNIAVGERWLEQRSVSAADPDGRYGKLQPQALKQDGGTASFRLERGQERLVRFPLHGRWVGERPLNNLDLDVWLTEADGLKKKLRGGWAARGLWVVSCTKADTVKLDGRLDEWSDRLPSFVYASQRLSGNYQHRQARSGSWRAKEMRDSGVRLLSSYDANAMYFAARVSDDDLRPADRMELLLDTDLLGDVQNHHMNEDDLRVTVRPPAKPGPQKFPLRSGRKAGQVDGYTAQAEGGYVVELALPWSILGSKKKARAYGMGFELRLIDADGSLEKKSELVLSGNGEYRWDDPRGWAQLLLLE